MLPTRGSCEDSGPQCVLDATHSARWVESSQTPFSPSISNEPNSKTKGIRKGEPNPDLGHSILCNHTPLINQPFFTWNHDIVSKKCGYWPMNAHSLACVWRGEWALSFHQVCKQSDDLTTAESQRCKFHNEMDVRHTWMHQVKLSTTSLIFNWESAPNIFT